MDKSTQVGIKIPQLDGRKSRCSEETMITNLSNHMPTLTNVATIIINQGVVRHFLNQNNCGATTLQKTMIQYAQAYGPIARLATANCSKIFPLYQAMKTSSRYA